MTMMGLTCHECGHHFFAKNQDGKQVQAPRKVKAVLKAGVKQHCTKCGALYEFDPEELDRPVPRAPRRQITCSYCGYEGHTSRGCPENKRVISRRRLG